MPYHDYYYTYYNLKKHLYRERYYERKQLAQEEKKMFAPYGGERAYYRQRLEEFGFIKKKDTPNQP